MVSPDLEIELRALSYLMTTVIHRLNEKDPVWWQGCLKEIKDEHKAIAPGTAEAHIADKVLLRVIGIVEHALASRMQPC